MNVRFWDHSMSGVAAEVGRERSLDRVAGITCRGRFGSPAIPLRVKVL